VPAARPQADAEFTDGRIGPPVAQLEHAEIARKVGRISDLANEATPSPMKFIRRKIF
jgi:hypothetical protein